MISDLMDIVQEFFLFQLITGATHRRGNTLDLLFSNNPQFLHSHTCTDSIFSDHHIVECATTYDSGHHMGKNIGQSDSAKAEGEDGPGSIFGNLNFFSEDTDWNGLNRELESQDWAAEFRSQDPHEMLHRFIDICATIAKKYVPVKKNSRSRNQIPRERRNLMRRRRRITVQLRKTTSDTRRKKLKSELKDIERNLQKSYQASREYNENKAVGAIKRNVKYFFGYAKKYSSIKTGIGPFIDAAQNIVSCPSAMAEMLSAQYSGVFSSPKEEMIEASAIFPDGTSAAPWLHNIPFDEDDIIEAIDEIPSTAAAGPDRIPALLLKNCKYSLKKPLFWIWRRSLDLGHIPQLLKTANIIPIHKGKSQGVPANYRPVALTSHLIKIFEKVIRKYIVAFMEENDLFNPGQHGFRLGRSCLSQMIAHYDHVTQHLEEGQNVDVIYLDFAKAFDKVDFLATMRKLRNMGISGKLGRWIHSFLTNRTQTVIVNGVKSHPTEVKSGVPQGSVLGPLLFLVLIGDIDQDVTSAFVSSFADDTRVAKGIKTRDDVKSLQSDLDSIYEWAEGNNMMFNYQKFECLRYGRNADLKANTEYTTKQGDKISVVEHAKDLGVIMSCNATFHQHISVVTDIAHQLSSWVMRTFRTRHRTPMLTLWKSLVLSKLDYCSQLWSPAQVGDIQALEQVQRNFVRRISGIHHLDYWQQLKALSLYSLERRRDRYIIIYVWRILEGQAPNFADPDMGGIKANWNNRRGRSCRVPPVSNQVPPVIRKLRHSSFAIRGPRLFNILPAVLRNKTECTVHAFKRSLDKFLETVPDEPQITGYTAMRRAESNSLIHMTQFSNAQQVPMLEELHDSIAAGGGHPWPPWD
jgi:hypothetical protein